MKMSAVILKGRYFDRSSLDALLSQTREASTVPVKPYTARNPLALFAEDKIRIVLEGLRGDDSIAELCR